MFDRCIASANAPLPILISGVNRFISIGVPADKLVVGVPWYGYDYKCVGGQDSDQFCNIPVSCALFSTTLGIVG